LVENLSAMAEENASTTQAQSIKDISQASENLAEIAKFNL